MADKITPEQLAAADQLNQKLQQGEVNAQEYAAALKEAGLELANQINLIDQKIAKLAQLNASQEENEAISQRISDLQQQRNDLVAGGEPARKQAIKDHLRQKQLQKELNDELQNSFGFMQGFIQNLADGGDSMEFLAAKAAELGKSLVDDFMLAFSASALGGIGAADRLTTQFNQLTGTAGSMNGVILNAAGGMSAVGVSTEMAAGAASELYQQFNQFSSANANLQTDMIQTTASLERLGVSSATTAQNIALATNAFGMGAQEATQLQDEMAKTAMAIGMPPAQLAQEFGKAAPQLSAYGKEGIQVFKNMAAASKGLGIEMGTLLGLTEQFDTFEGAAESAGRLNAMLGGDLLNSMDLLNATEDERIRMILQSVDASGKSWSAMGKFERKALANAAGITDMAEANKLFGGGLSAYDDAQAKMAENAKTEEELQAAKAASVSVTEKLSLMFDKMTAAMAPLVSAAHGVVNVLLAINDATGGWLAPTLGGLIMLFMIGAKALGTYNAIMTALAIRKGILAGATGTLAAAQGGQAAAQGLVAGSSVPAAAGTSAMGAASFAAAPGVAALALGLGMLALGFGLIAGSIAAVVWAFVTLIGMFMEAPMAAVQAAGALVVLGIAVAGLALIFAALAPIAPLAMVSMIMLGIGMMFLAVPMLILSGSFAILAAALNMLPGGAGMALAGVGLALIPFALSLAFAAPALYTAAILFAPAAILIGIGLLALGFGVSTIAKNSSMMPGLGLNLALFALGLLAAAFPMILAAVLFAPAALLVGVALMALGTGVSLLAKYNAALPTMGENLRVFAIGLRKASWRMFLASIFFAPAALLVGIALMALGTGVSMIVKYRRSMKTLGKSLPVFALGLQAAAPMLLGAGLMLGMAGIPFLVGALTLSAGLAVLTLVPAAAIQATATALLAAGPQLYGAAMWLAMSAPLVLIAGLLLGIAAPFLLIGAIGLAIGMGIISLIPAQQVLIVSMFLFAAMPFLLAIAVSLLVISPILFFGALGFFFASAVLAMAAPIFLFAATLIAFGLVLLNAPLREFAITMIMMAPIASQLFTIAAAFMALGFAMPIFGFGLFMLGLFASLPFVGTGLGVLSDALTIFSAAMKDLPTEKAIALGQIFSGLGALTDLEGVGDAMRDLANGIWWLSWSLGGIPEERLVTMGVALDEMEPLGELAKNLTPEVAMSVGNLVDEAERYVEVQAKMKSSKDDAFAQMVTASARANQARAEADKASAEAGAGGQDVVLVLNERELGRAMEAILNKRVNLSVS